MILFISEKKVNSRHALCGTHLPELLGCVLAGHPFQDLAATGVLIDEVCHVVDVAIDDDVEAFVGIVVAGHVGGGEGFGHAGFFYGRLSI